MGIKSSGCKSFVLHYKFTKTKCGLYPCNLVFIYGPHHALNSFLPVLTVSDQFGNHGIVVNGNFHTLFKTIVHPYTITFRCFVGFQGAYIRQEVIFRIFCIYP
ncbi:hypothetical protein D3C87_1772610 [compost metagenome]